MTDASPMLLDYYRALESRAQVMLACAREARWDDVHRVRDDCAQLIADLERARRDQALSPAENDERLRILRSIVLCDGQTRRLSSTRARFLDEVLAPRCRAN